MIPVLPPLVFTWGRRDATVKAARKQLAQLCCMPEQVTFWFAGGAWRMGSQDS